MGAWAGPFLIAALLLAAAMVRAGGPVEAVLAVAAIVTGAPALAVLV